MAMQEECFSLGEDSNRMLTITPFNKKRMAMQEERSHWVRIVIIC